MLKENKRPDSTFSAFFPWGMRCTVKRNPFLVRTWNKITKSPTKPAKEKSKPIKSTWTKLQNFTVCSVHQYPKGWSIWVQRLSSGVGFEQQLPCARISGSRRENKHEEIEGGCDQDALHLSGCGGGASRRKLAEDEIGGASKRLGVDRLASSFCKGGTNYIPKFFLGGVGVTGPPLTPSLRHWA